MSDYRDHVHAFTDAMLWSDPDGNLYYRADAADVRYWEGYGNGESSRDADWDFAMKDGPLELDDECEVDPFRMSVALAEILSPEQKSRLESMLRSEPSPASPVVKEP